MKAIWKYALREPFTTITHRIPHGGEIVHVEAQNGECCMWALVDESESVEARNFMLVGTGIPAPQRGEYLGTCLVGNFVWHAWELE